MKLISWNVRGLGGVEKRKEVRNLVAEKRTFILCLQETKQAACDYILGMSLWGDSNHAYSYRPSVGASGGGVDIVGYFGSRGVVISQLRPCVTNSWQILTNE